MHERALHALHTSITIITKRIIALALCCCHVVVQYGVRWHFGWTVRYRTGNVLNANNKIPNASVLGWRGCKIEYSTVLYVDGESVRIDQSRANGHFYEAIDMYIKNST